MPWLLVVLFLAAGAVAIAAADTDATPFRRRRFSPFGMKRKRRRPLRGLLEVFGTDEAQGSVNPESPMVSFRLAEIPEGRTVWIVNVTFDGAKATGTGKYRARIHTNPKTGISELQFAPIMPSNPADAYGMAEYLVSNKRGTVGYAGFSFDGPDHLMFNVLRVPDSGSYTVRIEWWGFEVG